MASRKRLLTLFEVSVRIKGTTLRRRPQKDPKIIKPRGVSPHVTRNGGATRFFNGAGRGVAK
jgi:hypothetical protein